MKTSTLASFALASTLLASAGLAAAQPAMTAADAGAIASSAPAPETRVHSINVSPLALLGGGFNLNYEYLTGGGHHGFLVEVGSSSWTWERQTTVNGQMVRDEHMDGRHGTIGVGYRYHLRGRQAGGFLGIMLHESRGEADVRAMEDGVSSQDDAIGYTSSTLTVHAGKRWMLTRGLNLTARIGVGSAERKVDDEDADKMAAAELQDTLDIPLAVDGELSLGWTF